MLAGIIKAVVRASQPEKIVMFGSAARGTMGPDSDIDLLVIKSGKFNHLDVSRRIYKELPGTAAVDVVVATPEECEQYRDAHCLVICPALKAGAVVYEAKAPADPREWLNRARSNLARARADVPDAYLEDLCFDAQQCAEKAIKAVFLSRGLAFPYVHETAHTAAKQRSQDS